MIMTIENKRRELFEAWLPSHYLLGEMEVERDGYEYADSEVQVAWEVFSAAIDAVQIHLPKEFDVNEWGESHISPLHEGYSAEAVRAAIDSTCLGLKVLP